MNKTLFSVTLVVALIALSLGFFFGKRSEEDKTAYVRQLETSTLFAQPRAIADFALMDEQGKPFTPKNLQGHWSLLFFGFTHCHHICPMTMAELNKTYQLLRKNHVTPPQVIFVSVDPERDKQPRLKAYVQGFNPAFKGVTGSAEAINAFTKNLNILYFKIDRPNSPHPEDNIEHSGSILLVNPAGQWAGVFSTPHVAQKIAHDFTLIEKNA